MKPPPQVLLACILCGLAAAWVALGPLDGMPHVSDEVVYAIQARLFAHGVRLGPVAENPSMLEYPFLLTRQGVAAAFPPGWPALLATGELLGAQALVNPLLAALLPLATWRLATPLTDARRAEIAAMVVACSPAILILAGSRMSHTSVLLALLWLAGDAARGRLGWGAGLALAYVGLARPPDVLCAALPLLLLRWPVDLRSPGLRGEATRLFLPAALGLGLLLADNHALTGSFWGHPADLWYAEAWPERPGCNQLGFGEEIGCFPTAGSLGHGPAKALSFAAATALRLDRQLLGFPGSGLLALVGLLSLGRRRPVLLLPLVTVPALYALYWSPGLAYGARFWHPLLVLLPLGLATLLARLPGRWPAVVLPLGLVGLLPYARELGDRYWCVDGGLREALAQRHIESGVVFLRGTGTHTLSWPLLGVEDFACTPMLEAGDAWALMDPLGPLRFRHMLPDAQETAAWLERYAPDERAWALFHDLPTDRRGLAEIDPSSRSLGPVETLGD